MDTPRRRSFIEKLLHHDPKQPSTSADHEVHSTTGLIDPPITNPGTKTIKLPLSGGGFETLVVPNDTSARDAANGDDNESWKYQRGTRKASVAAADTGDKAAGASDVEKAQYLNLMEQTKGMTPEQIREFLSKRGSVDGGKVMRRWEEGKSGDGYMQVVGADSGAM